MDFWRFMMGSFISTCCLLPISFNFEFYFVSFYFTWARVCNWMDFLKNRIWRFGWANCHVGDTEWLVSVVSKFLFLFYFGATDKLNIKSRKKFFTTQSSECETKIVCISSHRRLQEICSTEFSEKQTSVSRCLW